MSAVPTSRQLEELVWENLGAIENLSRGSVRDVKVSTLARQNVHSSRLGGEVRIALARGGDVEVWVKRVRHPEAAFERMRAAFERARTQGVAGPIPEPYFCAPQWGLIFMKKARGEPLRPMVLRHALYPLASGVALRRTLYALGHWLCRYHHAVRSDVPFDVQGLIAGIVQRLRRDDVLPEIDRKRVEEHLREIERSFRTDRNGLEQAWPHNDFSLRNIVVAASGEFAVLDWDAMAHPCFSQTTSGAWDVTLFLLNLYSLSRLWPIIRTSRLGSLGESFLSGYLDAASSNGTRVTRAVMDALIYLFALRFWYGIDVDRSLAVVYRHNFGWRFCRQLQRRLVLGPRRLLAA